MCTRSSSCKERAKSCPPLRNLFRQGRLPLSDFLLGARRTALAPGESMTAILCPRLPPHCARRSSNSARDATGDLHRHGRRRARNRRRSRRATPASPSAPARRPPCAARGRGAAPARRERRLASASCLRPEDFAALSPIDDVRAPRRLSPRGGAELTRRAVERLPRRRKRGRRLMLDRLRPCADPQRRAARIDAPPLERLSHALREAWPDRRQGRLQRRRLRRLHGAARRRAGLRLPHRGRRRSGPRASRPSRG